MIDDQVLRQQLVALLRGGNAHLGFEEDVADFPLEKINSQLPGLSYTPWRLLEHMRIAQWDILEFIRNPQYVSPPWPVGYWPAEGEQADEEKWNQTIAQFRRDLNDLVQIAEDPQVDLTAPIPHAPDYNILRELLLVADHNSYHLGEFGLFRDRIGAK